MAALRGVIAAAATPLTEAGTIDVDHLVEHCRWLLGPGGCDGINLLGTTGEATSFSREQRIEAMRAVAKANLPMDRFMVGTGVAAMADAVELTRDAKALGFAGALLLPPFYYKGVSEDGVVQYVSDVIEAVGADGLNLYLYHFPANSGVPYTVSVAQRLRERFGQTLVGLKDSSGDLEFSATMARSLPEFDVFPSAEGSIARGRELGFAGCISATANVTGPAASAAFRNPENAAVLQRAVEPRAAISAYPLVASVKAALAFLSGQPSWNRLMPPLEPLSYDQRKQLDKTLATAGLTQQAA